MFNVHEACDQSKSVSSIAIVVQGIYPSRLVLSRYNIDIKNSEFTTFLDEMSSSWLHSPGKTDSNLQVVSS